jgi:hypothetical protein
VAYQIALLCVRFQKKDRKDMAMEKVVENLQNFALGILPQIVQKRQIQAILRAYQSSLSL